MVTKKVPLCLIIPLRRHLDLGEFIFLFVTIPGPVS